MDTHIPVTEFHLFGLLVKVFLTWVETRLFKIDRAVRPRLGSFPTRLSALQQRCVLVYLVGVRQPVLPLASSFVAHTRLQPCQS